MFMKLYVSPYLASSFCTLVSHTSVLPFSQRSGIVVGVRTHARPPAEPCICIVPLPVESIAMAVFSSIPTAARGSSSSFHSRAAKASSLPKRSRVMKCVSTMMLARRPAGGLCFRNAYGCSVMYLL